MEIRLLKNAFASQKIKVNIFIHALPRPNYPQVLITQVLNQREITHPPSRQRFLTNIPVEMGWTELCSGLDFFSGFFLVFKLFNFTVVIPMDLSNVLSLSALIGHFTPIPVLIILSVFSFFLVLSLCFEVLAPYYFLFQVMLMHIVLVGDFGSNS